MAVAARFMAAGPWRRSDVVGNEGESEVDLRGKAQGPRERAGASGRRDRGDEGMAALSSPRHRQGGRRGRAPVPTLVGGTGKGDKAGGPGRLLGSWARWAGLACELGRLVRWGALFSFFICLLLLYFLFFYFFSFSVLFNLGHLSIL